MTCVLVKMPFNLAVFGVNKADEVYDMQVEIQDWYIGGHSLRGAMASSYAEKNPDRIKGLILLGSYPTGVTPFAAVQIYGSNDMVLNKEKLSKEVDQYEIMGGNHSYFGNYGQQDKDGNASISRDEQQEITVNEILKVIN